MFRKPAMSRGVRSFARRLYEVFAPGPLSEGDRRIVRYRAPEDLKLTPDRPLRVLVVGSCLSEGVTFTLEAMGHRADYLLFNNVAELPTKSAGEVLAYDFQLVQMPIRNLLHDGLYMNVRFDDVATHQALFDQACQTLEQMLDAALSYNAQYGLLTFVSNFLTPQQNPMGRLLPRYDIRNPVYVAEQLNRHLSEVIARRENVYLVDLDQVSATFGRMYHQEDHVWTTAHGGVVSDFDVALDLNRIRPVTHPAELYVQRSTAFLVSICHELEALFRTVRQVDQVKMVVIDLDDTLWRGVAAEQGTFGEIEGWPLGFAEALMYLKNRGVLLAIVSKNDEPKIEALWPSHFERRMSLADFAIRRINWRPKAENMAEILAEAGLLPRSVVFIDDNPVERAAVSAAFPDIRVLGAEPYLLRRILLWAPETQVAQVSRESGDRTEMIQAQVERHGASKRLTRDEFLASLSLRIRPRRLIRAGDQRFARAFELLNKTNQFNTTGRRWSHAEVVALFERGGALHAFEVEDRFSNYGLTGLAVVAGASIEQVVMSCRVVGLDVEIAMLAEVCRELRRQGHATARALSRETDANLLSRDLFERAGFVFDGEAWSRPLSTDIATPSHVASPSRSERQALG